MGQKKTRARSLVWRLAREISSVEHLVGKPASDEVMADRLTRLSEATVRLSQAPAMTDFELALKVSVLCHRLREYLEPEHQGELVTALLAEAIRDDIVRLAMIKRRHR